MPRSCEVVSPVVFGNRLVVVVRPAEPNFLHQRRGPDAVIRHADAFGRIGARAGKRLETTVNAERGRVERAGASACCSAR